LNQPMKLVHMYKNRRIDCLRVNNLFLFPFYFSMRCKMENVVVWYKKTITDACYQSMVYSLRRMFVLTLSHMYSPTLLT
jgi:hypothetical protein